MLCMWIHFQNNKYLLLIIQLFCYISFFKVFSQGLFLLYSSVTSKLIENKYVRWPLHLDLWLSTRKQRWGVSWICRVWAMMKRSTCSESFRETWNSAKRKRRDSGKSLCDFICLAGLGILTILHLKIFLFDINKHSGSAVFHGLWKCGALRHKLCFCSLKALYCIHKAKNKSCGLPISYLCFLSFSEHNSSSYYPPLLDRQERSKHFSWFLHLCSIKTEKSNKVGSKWGWVNDDRIDFWVNQTLQCQKEKHVSWNLFLYGFFSWLVIHSLLLYWSTTFLFPLIF